jgi:transcriptional regulator GlxA family with amidase domain
MLAYPDCNGLDVVGPLQVFASASCYAKRFENATHDLYRTEIIGLQAGPFTTQADWQLVASRSFQTVETGIDTLLIAGGNGAAGVANNNEVLTWLEAMAARVRRLGSVCTGTFILAASGLLQGRRGTTHWRYCDQLARQYPYITVEPDAIYVRDGFVYSSAGVTAGMDLALAMLEEDYGRRLALTVARELVLFLKRPGGQSQFSAQLAVQTTASSTLQDLQQWILDNLADNLSVENLAERVAMSPRHFARVFLRETGSTPGKFVERARLEAARRQLEETSLPLEIVAERCGFGHPETLRRVFLRTLGVGPWEYRQRFHTRSARRA